MNDLERQIERMRAQQRAILELARTSTAGAGDAGAASLARTVEVAAETMAVARASVWMLSADRQELRLVDLFELDGRKHSTGLVLSARDYPRYFAALESGRAIDAGDARTDPRTSEFADGYLAPLGIGAMLDATVRDQGTVVGVVCHEHVGGARPWTADEVAFAGALADQVSLVLAAVERHRLEHERERMFQQLLMAQKLESLGTLAAGVAHEINNPLAYLSSNLDFIADALVTGLERVPRAELDEAMRDAQQGVERVQQIVRDLRAFSRPEHRERHPVDVNDVIDAAAKMAWNEIRHRARLEKAYGRELPPVLADSAGLGQVVLNLLLNAAQSMEEGHADEKLIRVSTRAVGDRVEIEVADTGRGISPEIIDRVFDPFFTTKPVGHGTGLGLSICHTIVRTLGGEIRVDSQPGRGASFRIWLPAHRPAPAPAEPPAAASAAGPGPVAAQRRARVLVVDDEEALVASVVRYFRAELDIVGETAATTALARVKAGERFDLLLCDLMMPEMTGMELHDELRRIAPELAERTIFLTGGAFTPRARSFLDSTPNPRLDKPFRMAQLRTLIMAHLQRGQ